MEDRIIQWASELQSMAQAGLYYSENPFDRERYQRIREIAAEMLAAVREIDQFDTEIDRKAKIAGTFCKAYEKAILLTPTLENVRYWVDCTRMKPEEIEDSVQESYELAQTFQTIGDLLKNAISCVHQWPDALSDQGQS